MVVNARNVLALLLGFLSGAVVAVHAAEPGSATAVYESSLNKPGLYGVCKQRDPPLAPTYDQVLQGWLARNREAIERGKAAVRLEAQRTAMDADNMLRDNVAWAVADFARKSRYDILTACEDMLARDRKAG